MYAVKNIPNENSEPESNRFTLPPLLLETLLYIMVTHERSNNSELQLQLHISSYKIIKLYFFLALATIYGIVKISREDNNELACYVT